MTDFVEVAQTFLNNGFSVIPTGANKVCTLASWKPYQDHLMSTDEAKLHFAKADRLAVIGGMVSGNLECLDFDDPAVYAPFLELLTGQDAALTTSLVKLQTPSGGYHLIYRCAGLVAGNLKLAMTEDGKKVRIETRGEGGYFLTYPSIAYSIIEHNILATPTILPAQVEMIHALAMMFDLRPQRAEQAPHADRDNSGSPGSDFNSRHTVAEVINYYKWREDKPTTLGIGWTRPGKNSGTSGVLLNRTRNFYCWSSNAFPLEPGKSYNSFALYTAYEHNGNFKAAARTLVSQGYGVPRSEAGAGTDWPEPSPLPEGLPPVKSLEPDMIPDPLRGWIMDIADRMQIPPDFSAVAAVVALGSIIGRACGIQPKRQDDWLIVPNLWGAVVGRPSLMKTPAVSESQKHLNRLEAEARQEHQEAVRGFELDGEIIKITRSAIGEEIKKAVKAGNSEAIETARAKLAAIGTEEPKRKRYQTQDGTTEKIGELLNENPRGFLVNRDELIGWLRSLDRDGRESDRAFYLESWNGNRGFTYDRIGRGTLDIAALCLSVFGAITPGPLSNYVYQAKRGGNGDDGLLQRFQVIVWPDAPTEWKNVDRFPDTREKNRAWEIFKLLSGEIPGAVKEEGADIPSLRFSPGGQDVFDSWRYELETRLRGTHGLSPALESHLTKYRKLMPSLALIFHLATEADKRVLPGPVSELSSVLSVRWCEYLESHAGRIYGAETMPGMEAAREIVKHIRRNAIQDGMKFRELHRKQWSRLTMPDEVRAGLDVLSQYDWLTVEKTTTGGRFSEVIRLNPRIEF